jgi:hypothetical protein
MTQLIIMERARRIFSYVQEQSKESKTETFGASHGWFDRFKCYSNLHSLKVCGKVASADHQAAREFPATLKAIIKHGNYPPELVFSADETGINWKRMPSRSSIS